MNSNQLIFHPTTGIAGDMTISSLFHLLLQQKGQSILKKFRSILGVFSSVGQIHLDILESSGIQLNTTDRLDHELHGDDAWQYLDNINEHLNLDPLYAKMSKKILKVLIEAEFIVHSQKNITNPKYWNPKYISFKKITNRSHEQIHIIFTSLDAGKKDKQIKVDVNEEALNHVHLHEAADILIDASLTAWCLQELEVNMKNDIFLIPPVMIGGGTIKFSHGQFKVPVPAVKYILDVYDIPYLQGPVQRELVTPTGAAIIAALKPQIVSKHEFEKLSEKRRILIGKGFGHIELNQENALTCYYLLE